MRKMNLDRKRGYESSAGKTKFNSSHEQMIRQSLKCIILWKREVYISRFSHINYSLDTRKKLKNADNGEME